MALGTALDQMVDKTNESIKASENKLPLAVSKFVHVHPVVGKELTAGVGKPRKLFEKDLRMYVEGDPLGRLGTGSSECMFDE